MALQLIASEYLSHMSVKLFAKNQLHLIGVLSY